MTPTMQCPLCGNATTPDLLRGGGTLATCDCGRTWDARSAEVHCFVCHRHFGSRSALAMHRVGGRVGKPHDRCGTPDEFEPKGLFWRPERRLWVKGGTWAGNGNLSLR